MTAAKVDGKPTAPVKPEGPAKPPKKDAAKPAEKKSKEDAQADADAKAYLASPYASSWTDPDKYVLRLDVGKYYADFNNGNGLTTDHSGLTIGVEARAKFPFGKQNRWFGSAGLRFQHDKPSFDLNPGTSHANFNSIGVVGGVGVRAVPNWLNVSLNAYLAPVFMSSTCDLTDEGYCDGLSGTVVNLNAQAHEMDSTGFRTAFSLDVGLFRDILHLTPTLGKIWGGNFEWETVTQGKVNQGFSPGEFAFVVGLNFMPFFSKKTYDSSGWSTSGSVNLDHLDKKPEDKDPAKKPAAGAKPGATKKPAPKKEATTAQLLTQVASYKQGVDKANTRVAKIYGELRDTRRTKAGVLGGQDKKNARMKALADEAVDRAEFAKDELGKAVALLGSIEKKIMAMPEGDEKKKAVQGYVKARKDIIGANGDGAYSAYETVNLKVLPAAKKAVDYYNGYVKSTKSIPKDEKAKAKVNLDVDKAKAPEGYGKKYTAPKDKTPKDKTPKDKTPKDKPPKDKVPLIDMGEDGFPVPKGSKK